MMPKWSDLIEVGLDILLDDKDEKKPETDPQPAKRPAPDLQILVAPRRSAAFRRAEELASEPGVEAERKLFRALQRAAEYLNQNGPCTVSVKIAAGEFTGKANTGTWWIPKIEAPGSRLRLLGGYAENWERREPFSRFSRLQVSEDRTAPVLQLERESLLEEFYLSGLVMDAGPSNRYGTGDNLLTGQSNAYEILALSYLTIERLVISDNVFLNGGHRVAETLVRAASDQAEVLVRNNLLINNILTWRAFTAKYKHQPRRYVLEHNSFILNWPRNPDRTTSNPGTLEVGDRYTADAVEIRGNLFAHNVGGAIHPGQDDTDGPPLSITENLFWGNGTLFDVEEPGDAVVVGKFNRARSYGTFDLWDIEDNFSWEIEGNQVIDPDLRVQIKAFEGFSSVEEPPAAAEAVEEPPAPVAEEASEDDPFGSLDLGSDPPSDLFKDLGFGASGDETHYEAKGFAPRLFLDAEELPFPRNPEARAYGASPERVEQL
jgi:hypothetical protein